MTAKKSKNEVQFSDEMEEDIESLDEELDVESDDEECSKGRVNAKLLFQEMKAKLSKNKEKVPVLKAVRAKCLNCCCWSKVEVALCPCEDCALWPFRFGKNPYNSKVLSEEQRAAAAERMKGSKANKKNKE